MILGQVLPRMRAGSSQPEALISFGVRRLGDNRSIPYTWCFRVPLAAACNEAFQSRESAFWLGNALPIPARQRDYRRLTTVICFLSLMAVEAHHLDFQGTLACRPR